MKRIQMLWRCWPMSAECEAIFWRSFDVNEGSCLFQLNGFDFFRNCYIVNNFVFLYRYFSVYRLGFDPFRAFFRHTDVYNFGCDPCMELFTSNRERLSWIFDYWYTCTWYYAAPTIFANYKNEFVTFFKKVKKRKNSIAFAIMALKNWYTSFFLRNFAQ